MNEGRTMRTAGIDVGAKELVVAIRQNGKTENIRKFDNTPIGHRKLIKYLGSKKKQTYICIEATGVYR